MTTRIRPTLLLPAILVIAALTPGCAGVFDKCVKPEITAATKLAPADVAKEVAAFLICDAGNVDLAAPCAVSGLADLAVALGPGGDAAVNCIVAYYEQNGSGLQQARAKAVGAKRGVTTTAAVSPSCRGYVMNDSMSRGAPVPSRVFDSPASIPVDRVAGRSGHRPGPASKLSPRAAAFAVCDAACGSGDGLPGASGGCMCWRAKLKTSHGMGEWISAGHRPSAS